MNDNRSVLIMIAVVFVVVGIFLYFVFRSQQKEATQVTEDGVSEYTTEVGEDLLAQIAAEQEQKNAESRTPVTTNDAQNNEVISQRIDQANMNAITSQTARTTPQTGPGETAAVLATLAASLVAMTVYLRMKKGTHTIN